MRHFFPLTLTLSRQGRGNQSASILDVSPGITKPHLIYVVTNPVPAQRWSSLCRA